MTNKTTVNRVFFFLLFFFWKTPRLETHQTRQFCLHAHKGEKLFFVPSFKVISTVCGRERLVKDVPVSVLYELKTELWNKTTKKKRGIVAIVSIAQKEKEASSLLNMDS